MGLIIALFVAIEKKTGRLNRPLSIHKSMATTKKRDEIQNWSGANLNMYSIRHDTSVTRLPNQCVQMA